MGRIGSSELNGVLRSATRQGRANAGLAGNPRPPKRNGAAAMTEQVFKRLTNEAVRDLAIAGARAQLAEAEARVEELRELIRQLISQKLGQIERALAPEQRANTQRARTGRRGKGRRLLPDKEGLAKAKRYVESRGHASPAELANALGITPGAAQQRLKTLWKSGELQRTKTKGRYEPVAVAK